MAESINRYYPALIRFYLLEIEFVLMEEGIAGLRPAPEKLTKTILQ